MQEFLEFTLGGIAIGMIYAAIALSLVLIWRGTRVLNYSQGGMAMFTTYVAWVVISHTGNYWLGFVRGARLRPGARRDPRAHGGPADGRQVAAELGDRDDRAAHLPRGAGRDHLRRPVPLVPGGVLGEGAETWRRGARDLHQRPVHRGRGAGRRARPGAGVPVHRGRAAAAGHRVQTGRGTAARGQDRAGADARLGPCRAVRRAGRRCWSPRPRSCTRTAWTRSSCSASPPP